MREMKFKWKKDKRGLEIAMNMVVAVIVAVTVLGIVLYFLTQTSTPKSPPNINITPNSIVSGTATLVTVRVTSTDGKGIEKATVHLSGYGVTVQGQTVSNLPETSPVGNYAGTVTATLDPNVESGRVKVTVTSSYPEAIAYINVYKPQ